MRKPVEEAFVDVPQGVSVKIEGKVVTASGPNGTITRDFSKMPVNIEGGRRAFRVWAEFPKKREAAIVKAVCSHLRGMFRGVTEGFTYKLKIVHVYFPMTVRVEGGRVVIENFCGERKPRVAKIVGDVKVEVQKDDIIVRGTNVEDVGQTAANIEQATKVKQKDPRIFLDGIYVYEKS
ncbi:MAG: 50S ribosomal protein L6 [Candidatus Bathyarchaeia archaeon]